MPGWAKCQLLSTCDPLKLVSVGTCISLVYVSTCMNTLFLSYGESFLSDVRGAFLFVLSYLFPLPPGNLSGKLNCWLLLQLTFSTSRSTVLDTGLWEALHERSWSPLCSWSGIQKHDMKAKFVVLWEESATRNWPFTVIKVRITNWILRNCGAQPQEWSCIKLKNFEK